MKEILRDKPIQKDRGFIPYCPDMFIENLSILLADVDE